MKKRKQEKQYPPQTEDDEYHKQYHRRRKILIVDDEPDITSSFKEALRDHGFEQVDISNDPLLALKNFNAGSYDLLVIDIVMPQMDGFSLYEEIRKIDKKVKVCFITAFLCLVFMYLYPIAIVISRARGQHHEILVS